MSALEKIKKEGRKHPRVAAYLKLSDGLPKLKEHTICSYNISLGGMMLVVTPPLKNQSDVHIGESLTVSFVISTKAGMLNVPSTIVWTKEKVLTPEDEEASCLGVKFLNVPETAKQAITEFIHGKETKASALAKKTCRDCVHFKLNPGSRYSFCQFHRITVLNSDEDLTLSFNQIYSYPCKDLKLKE